MSNWLTSGGSSDALERLEGRVVEAQPRSVLGDTIDPSAPYTVAKLFIDHCYTEKERPTLRHHRDGFYFWSGSCYPEITNATLRSGLYEYLDRCVAIAPNGSRQPVKPTAAMVGNQRGYFRQPGSAVDAVRELEDLGSPIGAFLRERCETGVGYAVTVDDLLKVWGWWCEKGRREPGAKQSFGRDLRCGSRSEDHSATG